MIRLAIAVALVLLVVALRCRERRPVWLGMDAADGAITTVAVARRADGTLEVVHIWREPEDGLQPADPYPASLLP